MRDIFRDFDGDEELELDSREGLRGAGVWGTLKLQSSGLEEARAVQHANSLRSLAQHGEFLVVQTLVGIRI